MNDSLPHFFRRPSRARTHGPIRIALERTSLRSLLSVPVHAHSIWLRATCRKPRQGSGEIRVHSLGWRASRCGQGQPVCRIPAGWRDRKRSTAKGGSDQLDTSIVLKRFRTCGTESVALLPPKIIVRAGRCISVRPHSGVDDTGLVGHPTHG